MKKCYIYLRVSTAMQVDGYSLEAQKSRLVKYAEGMDMLIAGEYSDAGKSGKSVEGRPEFVGMLNDIRSGKDHIDYVLVFKLSRFGRNAADVLSSLQEMQDYGVNLICVEDGIDSSKEAGKLIISVLSAVAEIERENILVQTMEGRRQKAKEGRWNGGIAPYGYKLVNGELYINEDEAEAIRIIFDKYIHTNLGINGVTKYLNQHGVQKIPRKNGSLTSFSVHTVKGILDNPVYCGKIAFGRRTTEKVKGTRNDYHKVKADDYILSDGVHQAIISQEEWKLAEEKRKLTGKKYEKVYNIGRCHLLSGIVKCPLCGTGMYGNVSRKKSRDGQQYKDHFYYACKHRKILDGHHCDYKKQWREEVINNAVVEVIKKLVSNKKFAEIIKSKIGSKVDTASIDKELDGCKKAMLQLTSTKSNLEKQIDSLSFEDKHYERKISDLQARLDGMYDKIVDLEDYIAELEQRKKNIEMQMISVENIYQYLLSFDKLYDKFNDEEKKEFLGSFIEEVHLYEEQQESGQILKRIRFKFPVYYNEQEFNEISWDKNGYDETVVMLSHKKPDSVINVKVEFGEGEGKVPP